MDAVDAVVDVMPDAVIVDAAIADADAAVFVVDDVVEPEHLLEAVQVLEFASVVYRRAVVFVVVPAIVPAIVNATEIAVIAEPEVVAVVVANHAVEAVAAELVAFLAIVILLVVVDAIGVVVAVATKYVVVVDAVAAIVVGVAVVVAAVVLYHHRYEFALLVA